MNVLKLRKVQTKSKQFLIAVLQEGQDIQEHPEKLFCISSKEASLLAVVLKTIRVKNLPIGVNCHAFERKLNRARASVHAKPDTKKLKRVVVRRKQESKAVG